MTTCWPQISEFAGDDARDRVGPAAGRNGTIRRTKRAEALRLGVAGEGGRGVAAAELRGIGGA